MWFSGYVRERVCIARQTCGHSVSRTNEYDVKLQKKMSRTWTGPRQQKPSAGELSQQKHMYAHIRAQSSFHATTRQRRAPAPHNPSKTAFLVILHGSYFCILVSKAAKLLSAVGGDLDVALVFFELSLSAFRSQIAMQCTPSFQFILSLWILPLST